MDKFGIVIGRMKKEKKNADSVNRHGFERNVVCVLHHPMDAETHNIPPGE
jgi:hypothetical protein